MKKNLPAPAAFPLVFFRPLLFMFPRLTKRHLRSSLFMFLFCLLLFNGGAQVTKRLYLVGNSVTDAINYDGLKALAESRGNTHIWARHMIPGAPLEWLWTHPAEGFSEAPYGFPNNAFPNYTWDAISLEPFDRPIEGTNGDLAMCGNYINLAKGKSPNVQFYIYSRWPRNPYNNDPNDSRLTPTLWNQTWDQTNTSSNECASFFVTLTNGIRSTYTDIKPAVMVPVGQVFRALNTKMIAGQVPGYTNIWKVYADGIHPNGVGSYIAAITYYATLYAQDPRGLGVPSQYGTISPELATIIQQTAWDVIINEPLTGITGGGTGPSLRTPENPSNAVAGLDYSYYEGTWSTLPDFTTLTAAETGTVTNFDLTPKNRADNFGFRYTGFVNVPTDGNYTFYTSSDDGSKLYIGTTTVVNNDGQHTQQEASGTIGLKAGKHAISVTYFDATSSEVLAVSYSGPGIAKTALPTGSLFRVPSAGGTNHPPVAVLNATPLSGTAPLNVSFNATGSTDPDAGDFILGYEWNFGDNSALSNSNAPTHTYAAAGNYTATLRVVDDHNLYSLPITKIITVTGSGGGGKLSGTITGTAGSWNNSGNTRDKVFDGNTSTYFDAPDANANNAWAGLDLGSSYRITSIRYYPRASNESRMNGGKFQGSSTADFSSSVVDLYTIAGIPPLSWTQQTVTNTSTFRYVRYLAPANSWGNVAEVEFYGTNGTGDTQAPSVPAGLSASAVTQTSLTLSWTASTDNTAVTGYEIFRNGVSIGTAAGNSFSVTGLSAGSTYSLTVRARDAVPNWSAQSSALSVTTNGGGAGGTVTLNPVADTDTQSDVAAGTNPVISASQYNYIFMKFNLGSVTGTITSAKLRVYTSPAAGTTLNVSNASPDSWSEGSTKPALGTLIVASPMNAGTGYKEVDVTARVITEAAGDDLISFGLTTILGTWLSFNARENSSNKPQLVITTAAGRSIVLPGAGNPGKATEEEFANTAEVFPNPAKGQFIIRIGAGQEMQAGISITGTDGQQVKLLQQKLQKGMNTLYIPATGLASGVYCIGIKKGKETITRRIILTN